MSSGRSRICCDSDEDESHAGKSLKAAVGDSDDDEENKTNRRSESSSVTSDTNTIILLDVLRIDPLVIVLYRELYNSSR